jgi:hypothetical protein
MKAIRNSIGQPCARLGNIRVLFCAGAFLALVSPAVRASDPTGIYAFVDRVVFEPNDTEPERIQVWGAFALSNRANRDDYHDAERGYLYFKLRPGDEAVCKKEWSDLKSVAGTGQIVAFGSRSEQPQPKVRKADSKAESPDVHPKSVGINKVRMHDYAPVKQLEKLMEKTADAKGEPVPAGAAKSGSK